MPGISEDLVRTLAGFESPGTAVTSCYLDIDGRRRPHHHDLVEGVQRLTRRGRESLDGDRRPTADLEAVERFVRHGVERSGSRGLALFSCHEAGLWEAISLPVPVRDQVTIGPRPAVRQLEAILQEAEHVGVLLVDRQRARVAVFRLAEVVVDEQHAGELPRELDDRGERERGDTAPHAEDLNARHARRAAGLAFTAHQDHRIDRLLVGASPPVRAPLERALHAYLRERLSGRLNLRTTAPVDEVRQVVLENEHRLEEERERQAVDGLREARGQDPKAVAGLAAVLRGVSEGRIGAVLVSRGFEDQGWACPSCQWLATVGPACERCGETMAPVDDVVELAVDRALEQGARVTVCEANADLDVLGRVGAWLRF